MITGQDECGFIIRSHVVIRCSVKKNTAIRGLILEWRLVSYLFLFSALYGKAGQIIDIV